MSAYPPTNSPKDCPIPAASWSAAATPLPPTPDKALCACMYSSLTCAVKPGADESRYLNLLSYVRGLDHSACAKFSENGTTGKYSTYGMCNSTEQVGFAFDQYYSHQGETASACDFKGVGQTQTPTQPSGKCKSLIAEVSADTAASSATGDSHDNRYRENVAICEPWHCQKCTSRNWRWCRHWWRIAAGRRSILIVEKAQTRQNAPSRTTCGERPARGR